MLKKLTVSLLTLAFLTFGAGTSLAAPDPAKLDELKTLNQQMYTLKKQIVDKQLEAGLIDQEKSAKIKGFIEKRQKQMEEDFANGQYTGFGKKNGHGFDKGCKHKAQDSSNSPSPSDT
ncbi:MAG: DUF2680 domain-containing protein [Desulfosporosinus sp.]